MDQTRVIGNQNPLTGPARILVVDDDPQFVTVIRAWLERADYEVTSAFSGPKALSILERSNAPSTLPFDLVVLDVMMPGMRGTTVCRHIRANPPTAQIPVLVLTALSSPQERIQALEAGANDFVTKPFQGVELLARVKNLVHWRRSILKAQAELIQSAKMAATGRLAASLAHEINNPLQSIHNCLTLTRRFPLNSQEHIEYLKTAEEEVQRLITLVQRTLAFCQPSSGQWAPTDVNDRIEQAVALTQQRVQHGNVDLCLDLDPNLPPVNAVADQISQVILNLILHALQVIETRPDGGRVELTSRQSGPWVQVCVKGDGPDLAPEKADRMFEPLALLGPNGAELGLTISCDIVEQHGGTLDVESSPGQGVTFILCLPAGPPQTQ